MTTLIHNHNQYDTTNNGTHFLRTQPGTYTNLATLNSSFNPNLNITYPTGPNQETNCSLWYQTSGPNYCKPQLSTPITQQTIYGRNIPSPRYGSRFSMLILAAPNPGKRFKALKRFNGIIVYFHREPYLTPPCLS